MFYLVSVGGGYMGYTAIEFHETKLLKSMHFIVCTLYLNLQI